MTLALSNGITLQYKSWQVGARNPRLHRSTFDRLRPPKFPKIQYEIGPIFESTRTPLPPGRGFRQWTCFVKTQSRAVLIVSYSARAHCRVISELSIRGVGEASIIHLRGKNAVCDGWCVKVSIRSEEACWTLTRGARSAMHRWPPPGPTKS